MRPILFEILGHPVPAYGTTLVVVFIVGLWLLRRRVRPLGVSDRQMLDLATIAGGVILLWAGAGLLLARLGLAGPPHFNALPVLTLGAFSYLFYLRREGLPAERIFDAIAPIAALALAVQYGVGTLLAGTAFGKPTNLFWGLSFPAGSPAHRVYGAQPLHPVQLYLGISFMIIALAARFAPAKLRDGQRALMAFAAIAAAYLLISPFRGNTISFLAGEPPRMSELVALFILFYCSFMTWRRSVGGPSV